MADGSNFDMHYTKRKRREKIIRTTSQVLFLLFIFVFVAAIFISRPSCSTRDKSLWKQTDGFIAISYENISKNSRTGSISIARLRQQLQFFHDRGYETINSDDIHNFYAYDSPLPEKAIYIIFEDGLQNSYALTTPVLEDLDYQAAIFFMPKLSLPRNPTQLDKRILEVLGKSSYWEVGIKGDVFGYINRTDDSYDFFSTNYIINQTTGERESYQRMHQRLTLKHQEVYNTFFYMAQRRPAAYIFVPSNSYSMPEEIKAVNEESMEKYYDIVFFETQGCYNSKDRDIRKLTRLQIQPNWTTQQIADEIEKQLPPHYPKPDTPIDTSFRPETTTQQKIWSTVYKLRDYAIFWR